MHLCFIYRITDNLLSVHGSSELDRREGAAGDRGSVCCRRHQHGAVEPLLSAGHEVLPPRHTADAGGAAPPRCSPPS
jgi:hypothetical protein